MTRLAVLADIHGNLPALQAVMDDMRQFAVDHVIVAGDIVNWGPFSAAVMEIVTREGWAVIRGNNEFYLLDYRTPRQPAHWQAYDLLPWLYEQLEGHWHHVIASWPDEISLRFPDAPPVHVFHGSPGNPWRSLHWLMDEDTLCQHLSPVEEATVIGAHSHLALNRHVGRWHVLNPGSVGVPLDGDLSASYMLLDAAGDGWQPTFRRVVFDDAPLYREFERQRFVERYGVIAELVIREFRTSRLQVHPFNAWWQAHCPDQTPTLNLLAQFEQADYWSYVPPEYYLNRE
ncbi:MAG: metallophosphatase family protein [Anaerolineae bacterium]|nr:metallophosphatase family protein [Anaerolineae bacterium]